MEKHRAIPQGYMTVGELAKKMGVTVRTLQYYDKEGVLSPSSQSEGGRRLYTHKDVVKLHQIQSLKYLGFSLEDIKTRLPAIETPSEVSAVLNEQANEIREKIESLKNVLKSVEKLKVEVMQMDSVDWRRYADIVVLLQIGSDGYWLMKHLNESAIKRIHENLRAETRMQVSESFTQLIKRAAEIQKNGHSPKSKQAQALAKDWWDFVMEFTEGDMSLLAELIKMGTEVDSSEWADNFLFDKDFIEKALEVYFKNIEYNPLENKREDI